MKASLNCKNIDRLLYLTEDEMSTHESGLLDEHLRSCSSCDKKHRDCLAVRRNILDSKTDIHGIKDFESSDGFIEKTNRLIIERNSVPPGNQNWNKTLAILRYSSTIAAILLLCLFVSEQANSIHKISRLENRIQSSVNDSEPGIIDRITLARSILTVNEWTNLSDLINIKSGKIDSFELLRIKLFLENKIGLEQNQKLAFMRLFPDLLSDKKYAITLKSLIK
ncbi:MAG: hypothetical protein WC699_15745 [Bacteroidales bacterium]|jgi:hypothetical protein